MVHAGRLQRCNLAPSFALNIPCDHLVERLGRFAIIADAIEIIGIVAAARYHDCALGLDGGVSVDGIGEDPEVSAG